MKVVPLDLFSDKKIIFRILNWNLASDIDPEIFQFLRALIQKVLQDIKKSFEYANRCS